MYFTRDIKSLLVELESFRDWYESGLNIPTQGTRFEEIINIVRLLIKAQDENCIWELLDREGLEIYISLYDADLYTNIHKAFEKLPLGFLRKNDLKEIIKGPLDPREESSGDETSTPRNKLFELFLAAIIKNSEIEIVSLDDIQVAFKKRNIFIECKRLSSFSPIRLENNLKKAGAQIGQKINSSKKSNNRGVIALAIEKHLPGYGEILAFESKLKGLQSLKENMDDWIKKNENNFWKKIIDRRVLGIFVFSRLVILDEELGIITTLNHTFSIQRPRVNMIRQGDWGLIERFNEQIELAMGTG